jgi:hypothetical protein
MDGSSVARTERDNDSHYGDRIQYAGSALDVGVHTALVTCQAGGIYLGAEVASPIHTSSHYQTFETPFLHELVGGDRNMEQNNLIVTADGKSWDEVTRDTSYIGNMCVATSTDTSSTSSTHVNVFDAWRGTYLTYRNWLNKDFAIAYDRIICLVGGQYKISAQIIRINNTTTHDIEINGISVIRSHAGTSSHDTPTTHLNVHLKRGDYIQSLGTWHSSMIFNNYQIERV